jgi:hypothetical protein
VLLVHEATRICVRPGQRNSECHGNGNTRIRFTQWVNAGAWTFRRGLQLELWRKLALRLGRKPGRKRRRQCWRIRSLRFMARRSSVLWPHSIDAASSVRKLLEVESRFVRAKVRAKVPFASVQTSRFTQWVNAGVWTF